MTRLFELKTSHELRKYHCTICRRTRRSTGIGGKQDLELAGKAAVRRCQVVETLTPLQLT
jgi:hypothetical protein